MNRAAAELWSGAIGAAGTVIRYGHWGRPWCFLPKAARPPNSRTTAWSARWLT